MLSIRLPKQANATVLISQAQPTSVITRYRLTSQNEEYRHSQTWLRRQSKNLTCHRYQWKNNLLRPTLPSRPNALMSKKKKQSRARKYGLSLQILFNDPSDRARSSQSLQKRHHQSPQEANHNPHQQQPKPLSLKNKMTLKNKSSNTSPSTSKRSSSSQKKKVKSRRMRYCET